MIYLDTHVVFWLYAEGATARLSASARAAIGGAAETRVSPIVRMELQYLYEIDRIGETPLVILDELGATLGLRACPAPFIAVVHEAERHTWTRDPFDRLIVAQASLHHAPLVTKDRPMRDHYPHAVW